MNKSNNILEKTKRHHHTRSHIKDRHKPHTAIIWDTTSPRAINQPSPLRNNYTPKFNSHDIGNIAPPEEYSARRSKRVCIDCEFECDRECIELHPNSLIALKKTLDR